MEGPLKQGWQTAMVASSSSSSCLSTATIKVPLAAPVEEMWPALKNAVNIIAQYCPHFVHSCHLLHGDGGLGSIRLVKFGPASGLVTFAKEEVVELDEEKMVLTYLLLEGDLKKQFKVFKPTISLEKVPRCGESLEQKQEVAPSEKSLENAKRGVARSQSPLARKEDDVLTSENACKETEGEVVFGEKSLDEQREAPEGHCETMATWRLEYEAEEGMPPPQIELLNEGAKMFLKLLEASVEALKSQSNLNSTTIPLKEEAAGPTPLVA